MVGESYSDGSKITSVASGGEGISVAGGGGGTNEGMMNSREGGNVEVSWQKHKALEALFPSGNNVSCWGIHVHPLVSRVIEGLSHCGWSVRSGHRDFNRFTTRQWAEHHTENRGRGSHWNAAEWSRYFQEHMYFYALLISTLIYLQMTPELAWRLYALQAT